MDHRSAQRTLWSLDEIEMMAPPLLESDLGLRCVVALDEPELRRRPQRALCRAREKLAKDDALSLHQATLATADGGKLCFGGYVPAFNDFIKGDLRGASSMRARNACEMVARGAGHGDADVNQALIEGT